MTPKRLPVAAHPFVSITLSPRRGAAQPHVPQLQVTLPRANILITRTRPCRRRTHAGLRGRPTGSSNFIISADIPGTAAGNQVAEKRRAPAVPLTKDGSAAAFIWIDGACSNNA